MCKMKLKGKWGSDHVACGEREMAEASVLWIMVPFTKLRNSDRTVGDTLCVHIVEYGTSKEDVIGI